MFVLGPGDKLDIEMQGNSFTHAAVTIGLDGKIYYSLLPGVDVSGLTLTEARTRLEKEMSKFINQPQIVLSLKEVGSKTRLDRRARQAGRALTLTGALTLAESHCRRRR